MESNGEEQSACTAAEGTEGAENVGPKDQGQTLYGYEFGDFWLNPQAPEPELRLFYKGRPCVVLHKGKPGFIRGKPFYLLCILVKKHGVAVPIRDLIKELWPEKKITPGELRGYRDTLYHHVEYLRYVLGGKDVIPNREKGYAFGRPVRETPLTNVSPVEDLTFAKWLFSSPEGLGAKIFLAAGVGLSLLYALAYPLRESIPFPPLDPSVALSLIQFGVLIGALSVRANVFDQGGKGFHRSPIADAALMKTSGFDDPDKWEEAKAAARSSLERYSRYWKFLLIAWSCLYFVLIFTLHLKAQNRQDDLYRVLSITATLFNNCNSLATALCFVVLNHPTVFGDEGQNTSLEHLTVKIERWGAALIIAVALFEFSLLIFPSTRGAADGVIGAVDVVSGLVGGVTLALYVGRLQSKFLGPSTWLPLTFYLYVVMQALYVVIKVSAGWGAVIIEAALVLKCLLYLYVAWLFKSGRLLFYLVRVKKIYERVDVEWQLFLFNLDKGQ